MHDDRTSQYIARQITFLVPSFALAAMRMLYTLVPFSVFGQCRGRGMMSVNLSLLDRLSAR